MMTAHYDRRLFLVTCAAGLSAAFARQSPPAASPRDPALIEDLVAANRILAREGVVDAWGHVSVRHPQRPDRFYISRSLAPALVVADDIIELDLEGNSLDARGRMSYQERFIHSEIYRARPDVTAVVHCHVASVVPFANTNVALRPMFHMAAYLGEGVPVFDIKKAAGLTDMLVSNPMLGRALAQSLAKKPAALMRGHGAVVTANSIPNVVARAIYLDVNARMQLQALSLGGPITYLDPEEARRRVADPNEYGRGWDLWKRTVMPAQ
jgi:ribulose-5-phosphate 4-epimerase/fuculose-1-phosphate aldolase